MSKIIDRLYRFMTSDQIRVLFDIAIYILLFGVMYFFYAFTEFLER